MTPELVNTIQRPSTESLPPALPTTSTGRSRGVTCRRPFPSAFTTKIEPSRSLPIEGNPWTGRKKKTWEPSGEKSMARSPCSPELEVTRTGGAPL
jgi:hypothetical protein